MDNLARSILSLSDGQLERLKKLAEMCASQNSQLSYRRKDKNTSYSSADLLIIMLKGLEVGLEPMAALEMINVVHGKPALSPQGMLAKIYASPDFGDITVTPGTNQCSVTMTRLGKSPHTETFTMDDAKSMGLLSNLQWTQQPANMLKWRAVSACARVVFPDIIQGLYTPEELGGEVDYDDDGAVVDMEDTPPLRHETNDAPDLPDTETPTDTPEEFRWVNVTKIQTVDDKGNRNLVCFTDASDPATFKAFTRQPFIEAGWVDENELTTPGDVINFEGIPVHLQRSDKGYWNVYQVQDPFAADEDITHD